MKIQIVVSTKVKNENPLIILPWHIGEIFGRDFDCYDINLSLYNCFVVNPYVRRGNNEEYNREMSILMEMLQRYVNQGDEGSSLF